MTSLSERECEVRMSLTAISRDMKEPGVAGVAGVYRSDGTYCMGRPVFRQEGTEYIIYVELGVWSVGRFDGDLKSRTAPSLCPADPGVARNETQEVTNWSYFSKKHHWIESDDISVSKTFP